MPSASSSPSSGSTPPAPRPARGWAWPSPAASPSPTAAASPSTASRARAAGSASACRWLDTLARRPYRGPVDELINLLQRAAAALKQGRYDEAETLAREVLARDPGRA